MPITAGPRRGRQAGFRFSARQSIVFINELDKNDQFLKQPSLYWNYSTIIYFYLRYLVFQVVMLIAPAPDLPIWTLMRRFADLAATSRPMAPERPGDPWTL
ncbi:MAG: hypothetical protein MI741_02200 [Rhodospirillales bacterium]|nr:hypothetical protein [Rhodospirillales bacterium]